MEQNAGRGAADPGGLRDVRRWRRSRSDRMIAGVCGGVGRAVEVDPVLIRVVLAALVLAGPGVPLYIAGWLLMPEDGTDISRAQTALRDRADGTRPWLWPVVLGAAVFVGIGFASSSKMWPVSVPGWLIGGLLLWFFVFRKKDASGNHCGRQPAGTPGTGHWHAGHWHGARPGGHPGGHWHGARPGGQPGGDPAKDDRPQDTPRPVDSLSTANSPAAAPEPVSAVTPGGTVAERPLWTEDDPLGLYVDEAPATRSSDPRPRSRRGIKPAIVAATGLAVLISWLAGGSLAELTAVGLATIGAGMLLGGFAGRTLGLVPIGILLVLALAAASVFDTVPRRTGDFKYVAPAGRVIGAENYTLDAGSIKLDLSKANFGPDAAVVATSKAGEIVITLPRNVDVTGTAAVGLGELLAFDTVSDGHGRSLTLNDLGDDGESPTAKVRLDLKLKLGSIRVERE